MPWVKINKTVRPALKVDHYSDYKPLLAEEGGHQCVYCTIHEGQFGGERNFHVEHFKPQKDFPEYANTYENLFYSCSICNAFKGESWPGDITGAMDTPGFINPSTTDYNGVFTISKDYAVEASAIAPKYMIECVYLNRPQLKYLRRKEMLMARCNEIYKKYEAIGAKATNHELLHEIAMCALSIVKIWHDMEHTPPYVRTEIRRPIVGKRGQK